MVDVDRHDCLVILVSVDMPPAASARFVTEDEGEAVVLGQPPLELESRPRSDRAVALGSPRYLELGESDAGLRGPDRDVSVTGSIVLQVSPVPLRAAADNDSRPL